MTRHQHYFRRLAFIGLLLSGLAGCAVVPYGPPQYYDYPERSYSPVVPVPVPYFYPWHHRHHGHHGYRGHRWHRR